MRPAGPPWLKWVAIGGLLLLTFVVARGCQQSQIRITKEQAIAKARDEISFRAENVQIRMLRQGVSSRPYWILTLSVPDEDGRGFERFAIVRINANTGKVDEVRQERAPPREREPSGSG